MSVRKAPVVCTNFNANHWLASSIGSRNGSTPWIPRSEGDNVTDELRTSGTRRAVHLERNYDTSPGDLWSAWTDPARLARWLGTPAGPIVDAPGRVRISMGDAANDWVDVQVLLAQAPRLLELSWEFVGEPAGRLRVEFVAITPNRTLLILDHDGLDASSTGYGAGWQAFLDGPLSGLVAAPGDQTWDELFSRAMPSWRERAAELG